jgi:serine/threonine protein kinase
MIEGAQLRSATATGSSPGELAPGQQLGKYEILQRLASGGMAEIFLARAVGVLGFDKLVVIKRILPHLAQRKDFVGMFLDEARIATTLTHANVVQTHEVGIHGKSYFMVMEYLAGEDVRSIVRALIKRGERLPLQHALEIAIGVAAGLHYAHEKKDREGKPLAIVHRDVTPQNVIVTFEGGVKLLDFGIAKAANRINETRSGSFKGKVPYMSPEQCRGEPLDRRSDIFSLGIMLHEMTLGRRLFRGETDFQILKQIVEGPIARPSQIEPSYDPELDAIVMRALERDPKRRFASARELQEALEELAHQRRLRLSPLSLADFVRALFGDQVGAWERAAAASDREQLQEHLATVLAVRQADLAAEESAGGDESEPLAPASPPPSVDVALESFELRPRRGSRVGLVLAGALAAAIAVVAWRARVQPPANAPSANAPSSAPANAPQNAAANAAWANAPAGNAPSLNAAAARSAAAIDPASPDAVGAAPAAALLDVQTVPDGAELILDGKLLAQHSPARLAGITPGATHTLVVRLPGHAGVAQRFSLDAGEEASMEIDLRRAHAAAPVKHVRPARDHEATRVAAAPRAAAPPIAAPPPPAVAPAPPRPEGEGTLVVASSPWCNVTVDGQARGTTPLSVKLKAGAHQVVLANPEFHIKRTLAVEVAPNQTVRKSLDFAPE